MGAMFAIFRLVKFALIVVGLIVLGAVLIKARRKRREQFHQNLQQLLNEGKTDDDTKV